MATPITIQNIPSDFSAAQQSFLQTVVNAINNLQSSCLPPNPPSDLQVTPIAGGNLVQFTPSNGDDYAVYRALVNDPTQATRFDIGLSNTYSDFYGTVGVQLFYWVKAKLGQLESTLTGAVSGVTLALNMSVTQPLPVAPSQSPTTSDLSDSAVPGNPTTGDYAQLL